MPRLATEERDAFAGQHCRAHDRPARTIDATRKIDGDDCRAAQVYRSDDRARFSLHGAIETGAKQCIDDDTRTG